MYIEVTGMGKTLIEQKNNYFKQAKKRVVFLSYV